MAQSAPYNYRDPNYADYIAGQAKPAPPPPPGLDTSGGTTLVPDISKNPPAGQDASLGRWIGNQWVLWSVVPPPHGPEETPPAPPPDAPAAPPEAHTNEAPASPSSAPAAAPPPPSTTLADTYRDVVTQLLNSSGPSTTPSTTSLTPPTRPTSTLVAPTPTTVPLSKIELPAPSEFDKLVHDQIVKMLSGPTAEEAGAAAAHSLPVSAFRNSVMRDLDKQRAGAAEQSGLNGTAGSGGFEGQVQGLRQAAGESTAKFTGEYVDKAMAERRAELQQALLMAQQQGNFEDQQALAAQIAALDNQVKQQSNANSLFNTQSSTYLGQLGNEENLYKDDLSKWSTGLDYDLRNQANENTRYNTETQKLLGMSDLELRKYLGDMADKTSRYGTDVNKSATDDRLGFDYMSKYIDQLNRWIDSGMKGPRPVLGG